MEAVLNATITSSTTSTSPSILNSTMANVLVETTSILNNLTDSVIHDDIFGNSSVSHSGDGINNDTGGLLRQALDDDTHKNPELKYFSTVIIIVMGLAILIVPVFCFIGVVCARARIFRTVREAAGKGWGFNDADVPYAEFGSDDYSKDKPDSRVVGSKSRNCDVKILVADDNHVPSSKSHSTAATGRSSSFLRFQNSSTDDEDDISPTFVHS